MRTPSHHALGALTGALAAHAGLTTGPGETAALLAAAAVFSGGALSCDVDNQGWWKTLDRWVPDEWLGEGGPLQHRGLMHWWGLPLGWWFAAGAAGLPPVVLAAVHGVCLAWWSHIAGDLVFGRANLRVGLRKGVPLCLWFWHVGVGFRADGWVERVAAAAVYVGLLWVGFDAAGVPPSGLLGIDRILPLLSTHG